MNTATIIYSGNLRTQATHLKSGEILISDAPTDNNGKGEAFSPTDLLSTSLVSCMLTIMGIAAKNKGIMFNNAEATMKKIMADNPRRVDRIQIEIKISEKWTDSEKRVMETAALNCPVAKSLSKGIIQEVEFSYN